MRVRWWTPEPGDVIVVLLGAGLGFVWLMVGFTMAMQGWLGTVGGGSWNVPGPAFSPLGVVRSVIIFPIYAASFTLGILVELGQQPGFGIFVILAILYSTGLGAVAGILLAAWIRLHG